MSMLHFDHVHIINITCLIIIMTIFNISTLIIRAARDSGAKGDCRRLQRGCPLSIFNMPLFNSPWFQLNVYNCPLLISCVQVLDRPLPAIAVIKHIFHFAALWKIVLLFGVKCFSPDCLWLIVALFLSSSRMIFFHPVCSSCSLEAPGSWPGYLTANPHFKENTKQTPGIQMYKWTFVTQFSPPPQMKDLKEKFCKTSGAAQRQGCIFVWCAPIVSWPRIMCSQVRMLKFLEPSREMRKIRVSEGKKIVLDFLLTNMQWISD